jgi:hypothetical protein
MTIDKIKHYMDDYIFNFWVNCGDKIRIEKALNHLTAEMQADILPDEIKYHAEIQLLKHLLQ